jgi:hypothetical protein
MKKIYFSVAALLAIALHTTAQTLAPYAFTKTTETYTYLSGGTSLNQNQIWDDPEFEVPIGFNFQFFGQSIDSLYIGAGLGALVLDSYNSGYALVPFEADLIDRGDITGTSVSPITYKLEGTPGNRIFKLEWRNAGFYNEGDSLGTLNDYVNIQLWLFENNSMIEMHYGASSISNAMVDYYFETGAVIGVENFIDNQYLYLSGTTANPTPTEMFTYINGTPADGTVYRFTPTATGIEATQLATALNVFPNPMQQTAVVLVYGLTPNDAQLRVYDAIGRTVKQIDNINSNQIKISREGLSSGIYNFQLTEENHTLSSGKLMVD